MYSGLSKLEGGISSASNGMQFWPAVRGMSGTWRQRAAAAAYQPAQLLQHMWQQQHSTSVAASMAQQQHSAAILRAQWRKGRAGERKHNKQVKQRAASKSLGRLHQAQHAGLCGTLHMLCCGP